MDFLFDPVTLTKGGIIGLLSFALAFTVTAFVKLWIVPGVSHVTQLADKDAQIQKLIVERDEFKRLAMQSIEVAERTQRVRGGGYVGARKESP